MILMFDNVLIKILRLHACLLIILELCVRCEGFKTSNLHEFCGATINDDAGELKCDTRDLPSNLYRNKCSVTVQPHSHELGERTQALFYFTKFDLFESCELMNVSVREGSFNNETIIEGLPKYICGHNSSLLQEKDIYFTTKTNRFTVTFSRHEYATYSLGNFTIKFAAFHKGECGGVDVSNCSNGFCIPSKYMCSDDINACGETQIQCDYLQAIQELLEEILEIVQKYIWVVPVLIGLCVLKCIYKKNKECICGLKSSAWSNLRSLVGHESSRNRNTNRRTSQPNDFFSLRTVQSDSAVPRSRVNEYDDSPLTHPPLASLDDDSYSSASSMDNMTSSHLHQGALTPTAPLPTPTAPPPSYDEAVAPSYDEVVGNKHKYQTK